MIKTGMITRDESTHLNYHTQLMQRMGLGEHESNLTAMQTSDVDPHRQQNGGLEILGHKKLVNA
jgi:hypothetical protein